MSKRVLVVVAASVAALVVALIWWKGSPSGKSGKQAVTATGGSGATNRGSAGDDGPHAGIDATVHGANGEPIAGAVVRIAGGGGAGGGDDRDGDRIPRATGTDGRVSFDVAPGHYRVTAALTGHAPAEAQVDVPTGARAAVELALGPTAPIVRGTVSDANGGPIAGAIVTVAAEPGMLHADTERAVAAITDGNGKFATSVLPGRYQIATRHPEYIGDHRSVDVGADGVELAIQLAPGGVIEGRVVDRSKGPVAGATVTWRRELASRGPFGALGRGEQGTTTAGADGAFRLTGLGAGRIELDAETDDGRASREPTEVELGIAETATGVEVAVAPAPTIAGIVVRDDTKQPVPGAMVMVQGPGMMSGTAADDHGRFRITGVAPGSHRLVAHAADALEGEPVTVEVGAAPIPQVTLTVKAGMFITGRVDPPGPAEISEELPPDTNLMDTDHMRFVVGGNDARTEADGTFKIGPFPPGEVHLKAQAADGRQGTATVTVPVTGEVVIALADRGSIAGRVVDANGDPLPGVTVSLHRTAKQHRTVVVNGVDVGADRAPVDAQGRFELRGRDAGTWELSVLDARGTILPFAKGADPDQPVRVPLREGEHKDGVTLAVDAPTGAIRGVVVDQTGAPVADAWVSVSATTMMLPGMGRIGGPGRRGGGGDGGRAPPPPGPGPGPGGDDGGGESDVMVAQVISDDGSGGGMAGDIPPVLTGSDGTFAVTGLRKGSYDVTAEGLKGGARGTTADVAVEHGPVDTKVTIVALGSIAGVVTTAGKPVVDYRLSADSDNPGKRRTIHADDGAYKLGGLDPGHYLVTATSEQGTGTAEVDVVAGQTAQAPIAIVGDAHVQGRFVDAAGAPLADRMVLVTPRQAPGSMMITMEGPPPRTAADGTFSVSTPAGARTLLILGQHGPELNKDIDVAPGQQLDVGTVKAEPPAPPQQAQGSNNKPTG